MTEDLLRKSSLTCLGEEVDADGGLVHVVERVIHEAGNERCLANCFDMCLANIVSDELGFAVQSHTALFSKEN